MSKIKILSEQVANQIAAGEVVERPASVVKEFVENAIDAGARHLAVQVEGNGTRLIRVVDDGEGMDQDDVLLCLERHATSKLGSGSQLGAIRTLGFRGEAVPSIASVAMLSITSRPAASPLGTQADVRFGTVVKVHEMGCSQGTVMEVRDLFGNVPARRKFLKTAQTELAHIEEVVKNYGLAAPELALSYAVNGREVFSLPGGVDTLEQRLRRVLGRRISGPLVTVAADPGDDLRLTGYLLPPDEAAASAPLTLFVNGRVVRDRLLGHAVTEGLRGFLLQGRRPAGVLFVELPPEEVDVNVHPTKQEVRFRQPSAIHHRVTAAVTRAMAVYQQKVKRSIFEMPSGLMEKESAGGMPKPLPDQAQSFFPACRLREPESVLFPAGEKVSPAATGINQTISGNAQPVPGISREDSCSVAGSVTTAEPQESAGRPPVLKLLGQLLHSYLLCENSSGLVVIDQHAAHERLLFEQLKKELLSRNITSQTLLFPKMLELRPEQMEVISLHRREIERFGIEIQEFGGATLVIKALPALLAHLPPEEVLLDILGWYSVPEDEEKSGSRLHSILATMACKAAIKAGLPLAVAESTSLLRQMHDLDLFSHCPHGRPVMKCFSINDLKKWFHRT
jgi:DNA mismatch repair protein MutL